MQRRSSRRGRVVRGAVRQIFPVFILSRQVARDSVAAAAGLHGVSPPLTVGAVWHGGMVNSAGLARRARSFRYLFYLGRWREIRWRGWRSASWPRPEMSTQRSTRCPSPPGLGACFETRERSMNILEHSRMLHPCSSTTQDSLKGSPKVHFLEGIRGNGLLLG